MASMFFVTADVDGQQRTEWETTPRLAAWVHEFRDRGAKEIYIRDEKRRYTEAELEELAHAQRP